VWTVDEIAQITQGRVYRPSPQREIKGFAIDSRSLQPNEFFVALPGERTDGHHYLSEAFERGASGALIQRPPESLALDERTCNLVVVHSTQQALQTLASAYRERHTGPIVGVTGSSGKTTTKELIYAILRRAHRAYRSPGNYNTEIGLPLALLSMPPDTEVGVFELALQRPGEIKTLAEIARPTIGVLTTIGDAHLGSFRDREELARAKWELIEYLPSQGYAVLNFDAPYLAEWAAELPARGVRVHGFGIDSPHARVRARAIRDDTLEGITFTVHTPDIRFDVRTQLLGRANVYNALAAVAVALVLKVDVEHIQQVLEEFEPVPHRLELKRSERFGLILDDSYNANPTSTREALRTLARLRVPQRKVLVFGEMLELGDSSRELHRELAEVIDELDIDRVFTIGELTGETARALSTRAHWGPKRVMSAATLDELSGLLFRELLDDENVILVKGSRGMRLEQLMFNLLSG